MKIIKLKEYPYILIYIIKYQSDNFYQINPPIYY